MASLNALDTLTVGELVAIAETCADACAAFPRPLSADHAASMYFLRSAIAKCLAASVQIGPTEFDFEQCAAIMRRANGG